MTPILRKHHRTAWYFLIGFLPVLFVAAIMVLPDNQLSLTPAYDQVPALPNILGAAQTGQFTARLRGGGGERQLEIESLGPLANPSTLVYLTDGTSAKPEAGTLLGSLSGRGVHRFSLGEKDSLWQPFVVLYDPIKNTVIQALKP